MPSVNDQPAKLKKSKEHYEEITKADKALSSTR